MRQPVVFLAQFSGAEAVEYEDKQLKMPSFSCSNMDVFLVSIVKCFQKIAIINMPPEANSRATRSAGPLLDPDINFPACERVSKQLPDIKMVIGLVKFLLSKTHGPDGSEPKIVREVGKLVYTKWWHDTVYCISLNAVVKRVQKLWAEYKEGLKRLRAGRDKSAPVQRYKEIIAQKDHLFDVFAHEKDMRDRCEIEWGVRMSLAEKAYYEDQKGERNQECDRAVDPVWYTAAMRRQRLRERDLEAKKEMQERMQFRSLEEIEEFLMEDGAMLGESPQKSDVENNEDNTVVFEAKRKLDEQDDDCLPLSFRHVRDSERKVKEVMYRCVAKLIGKGLSLAEAVQSVTTVANMLFDRHWKDPEASSDEVEDLRDKMPSARSIRDALALLETEALASTVDMMEEGRKEGRMVTHAIDSTTKRNIGQFATQGFTN